MLAWKECQPGLNVFKLQLVMGNVVHEIFMNLQSK